MLCQLISYANALPIDFIYDTSTKILTGRIASNNLKAYSSLFHLVIYATLYEKTSIWLPLRVVFKPDLTLLRNPTLP